MHGGNSAWDRLSPNDKRDAVKVCAAEGISTSQAALRLGAPSRNAVIGVANRHKITFGSATRAVRTTGKTDPAVADSRRAAARKRMAAARAAKQAQAGSRAAPRPDEGPPPDPGLNMAALDKRMNALGRGAPAGGVVYLDRAPLQCGWIIDDQPVFDRRCCGAPLRYARNGDPGAAVRPPYCDDHLDLAHGRPIGTTANRSRAAA